MEGHSALGEPYVGPQSSTGASLYLQSDSQDLTHRDPLVICMPTCTRVPVHLGVSGGQDPKGVYLKSES